MLAHVLEDPPAKLMALQQMAELARRGLVGYGLVAQVAGAVLFEVADDNGPGKAQTVSVRADNAGIDYRAARLRRAGAA